MYKRDITQLAIYQVEEDVESISLECLQELYIEKTSDIVYITKEGKLYAIVCLSDILHNCQGNKVMVNRSFTFLMGYNAVKASMIFRTKRNINKIPVVNEQGELLGDYSRWNELFYIEYNPKCIMRIERTRLINVLKHYRKIYVVEPAKSIQYGYMHLMHFLNLFQVEYVLIDKKSIKRRFLEESLFIFLNTDEQKGIQCLYGIDLNEKGVIANNGKWKACFVTYFHLIRQMIMAKDIERVDEKATIFFTELKARGVKCFAIFQDLDRKTEYMKNFKKEIEEREAAHPCSLMEPWPNMEENEVHFKKFYGELGFLKDYRSGAAQREIFNASFTYRYQDISGKYFNAKNGQRVTCFQPKEYIGTIYLLGKCAVLGIYQEDQYTIGSCLQKKLLEQGYKYKVENYGSILRYDGETDSNIQRIQQFRENDIVIIAMDMKVSGITSMSFEEIFEEHQISSEWVIDADVHCNHKCNQVIAGSILKMIEPSLNKKVGKYDIDKVVQFDTSTVMKRYVKLKYLNEYFENFPKNKYRTIGAIVMNGSLFTKGHRYFVEQARQQVEFLIIFVIEQSTSSFSFEDRFKMIVEGTKDISNIMVVPNGDFIFSRNTFPEFYGGRREIGRVKMNAEYDSVIFADYIAEPLHITHRFTAEESKNNIMKIYQEVMGDILRHKGIAVVRIPRLTMKGEEISSVRIQRYMEEKEYEKVFMLVPESTKQYLV